MSAGFVPVDAVFSGENAGFMQVSAGERLREARVKAGLTLDSAAARTRIRREYLEALETMDTRELPARAYAIGYLRTYAGFLELEPVEIVDQFKREVDTDTGRAQPTAAAQTRKEIKLPRGVFGAIFILASVASIAWWYAGQSTGDTSFENLPSPPDAAPEWARADFETTPEAVRVDDIWSELPLGQVASLSNVLVMRAVAPTWFEVRDRSGRILFSRQLETGESYRAMETGLTVSATDAGAIEMEMDGESVGPLGELGLAVENLPVLAENDVEAPAETPTE